MANWTEKKHYQFKGESPAGSHTSGGIKFALSDGSHDTETTVSFASPGRVSLSAARNAMTEHLRSERPPRRLLIDRDGNAHVAEE